MWVTGGRAVLRKGTPRANALGQTPVWHGQGTGQCGRDDPSKGKSVRGGRVTDTRVPELRGENEESPHTEAHVIAEQLPTLP